MAGSGSELKDRTALQRTDWTAHRPVELIQRLEAHRPLGESFLALEASLMEAVAPRVCELVALRVGAARDNAYIWSGHVATAQSSVLTSEEIAGVAVGPTAFEGHDAAVLSAVDTALVDGGIDAATQRALGDRDALSVRIATQFYETLASIMQGAGPEPGTPVIPGVETPSRARQTAAQTTSAGISALTGRALPGLAEIEAARQRNLQRGFDERKRLLADVFGVREVAALLDVGRQTPHDRRVAGTLLGVKDRGQWRFPRWQFDADGPEGVVQGLPEVLQALGGPISDLGRVRWFVTPNGDLGDRAPIDALRSGDVDDVVALARVLGAS